MHMETLKTGKLEELLGAEADALLNHTCKAIDKKQLNLPGPDFVDRCFAPATALPKYCGTCRLFTVRAASRTPAT